MNVNELIHKFESNIVINNNNKNNNTNENYIIKIIQKTEEEILY